jgi:Na+-transporting methylmalonyl-CoA/oxaloacetate decarboxylase gamma subunit
MDEMPMTMMWGMGIVWLLVLVLLVLAIAALIKYLRT